MPVADGLQRRVRARKDQSDDELIYHNQSPTSGRSDTAWTDEAEGTSSSDSDHESDQDRDENQVRRQQTKSLSSDLVDRP